MKNNIFMAVVAALLSTTAMTANAQDSAIIPPSLAAPNGQAQPVTLPAPVAATAAAPEQAGPVSVMPQTVQVSLSFKEQAGVDLANEWKDRPELPREGPDGAITYLFGAAMPTLVCSPLQVCTIALEPGEVVAEDGVHGGDTARWNISPSTVGTGDKMITYVVVKPRSSGLETNLFLTTDRRAYMIKLVSAETEWMPILSFDYPAGEAGDWASYRKRVATAQKPATTTTRRTSSSRSSGSGSSSRSASSGGGANLAKLNFNYSITGDNVQWRPVRVYTDGRKTYIQFASNSFPGGAPALVALDRGGKSQMVNYRLSGDRYVVDQVLQRADLVAGTGRNQSRVRLTLTR